MYLSFSGGSFTPFGMCLFDRVAVVVIVAIVESSSLAMGILTQVENMLRYL
jgi:hypothetical protein